MLLAAAALSFNVFAEAKYKAAVYNIDPAHSKVSFEVTHLVISTVEGNFKTFDGAIDLKDKFDKSSVKANVDVTSIDTGTTKRDDHLRSPDFFDATKFPKMTFESTEIKGTPEDFKLTGNLTMHGVTKKVTFEGKFGGQVNDGYGNDKVGFTAKTVIKRQDFGLKWNKAVEAGPVVGDDVTIILRAEAGHAVVAKK
jgi:polyisoprenoid-binding protein YceI